MLFLLVSSPDASISRRRGESSETEAGTRSLLSTSRAHTWERSPNYYAAKIGAKAVVVYDRESHALRRGTQQSKCFRRHNRPNTSKRRDIATPPPPQKKAMADLSHQSRSRSQLWAPQSVWEVLSPMTTSIRTRGGPWVGNFGTSRPQYAVFIIRYCRYVRPTLLRSELTVLLL